MTKRMERKVSVDVVSRYDWSSLNEMDVVTLQTITRRLRLWESDAMLIEVCARLARSHLKALRNLAYSNAGGDAELLWNFDWSLAHHLIYRNACEQRGLWEELDEMDVAIEREYGAFWSAV